jgi:hypothetical protein
MAQKVFVKKNKEKKHRPGVHSKNAKPEKLSVGQGKRK